MRHQTKVFPCIPFLMSSQFGSLVPTCIKRSALPQLSSLALFNLFSFIQVYSDPQSEIMMRSISSSTLLLLFAGIIIFAVVQVRPRDLDCRRFVFAPMCRGATIKRSSIPNIGINQEDVREMLLDYPKKKIMDAETHPLLMPILIDRRFFDVSSSPDRHQPNAEDEVEVE